MRKKLLASILGVVLALTMAVPAMAVDTETATFAGFTLNNVSEVRVLEEEDPSMMMAWRTYLFVCPENATLSVPVGEPLIAAELEDGALTSSRRNVFLGKEGAANTQLAKGYYCINQLSPNSGDATVLGESMNQLDFVDVYIAAGMPVPGEFANAKDVLGGAGQSGAGQSKPADVLQAYARAQSIQVDGKDVTFQTYALKDGQGNETNYVKLRDIASVLNGTAAQFHIAWDGAIHIQTKSAYAPDGTEMSTPFSGDRPYTVNTAPIKIDGAAADLEAITLTDTSGGYTYFKLRDLGKALGFNVSWDGAIKVNTSEPYSDAQ